MVASLSVAAYEATLPWYWNWTWLQGCTDNVQTRRHIRSDPRKVDGTKFSLVRTGVKARTLCGRPILFGYKGKLSELPPCKRCEAEAVKLREHEDDLIVSVPERTPGEIRKWMKNRTANRTVNPWKKGTTRSGRLTKLWAKKSTNKKQRQQHLRLV